MKEVCVFLYLDCKVQLTLMHLVAVGNELIPFPHLDAGTGFIFRSVWDSPEIQVMCHQSLLHNHLLVFCFCDCAQQINKLYSLLKIKHADR